MKSKLKWSKCASVTTGGKPFFWTTLIGAHRYWVRWNRITGCWQVFSANIRVLYDADSADKCKRWLESHAPHSKLAKTSEVPQ